MVGRPGRGAAAGEEGTVRVAADADWVWGDGAPAAGRGDVHGCAGGEFEGLVRRSKEIEAGLGVGNLE